MKTRKLTALILSVLMIVSMITTNGFAAPTMANVAESTIEEAVHEHEHDHSDNAEGELTAVVNESWKEDEYKTFENGFYTLKDTYVICNTCKSYVYVANDYSHSIFLDYINSDYSTAGQVTFTFNTVFPTVADRPGIPMKKHRQ